MNWREGLVLYANNKMVLNGESVVEAFMSERIFNFSEMERWDSSNNNETFLTPVLIERIIKIFENHYPNCPPLKIETLFKAFSGPLEDFQANTDDDWEKVMNSMLHYPETEDSIIIVGLSKDKDGKSPMSIWSWNNDITFPESRIILEDLLIYWGVPPANMTDWKKMAENYFTINWFNIDEPDPEATLFNNRTLNVLRWEGEPEKSFSDYRGELSKGYLLSFALKITSFGSWGTAGLLNWSEFPVSLI